MCYVTNVMSKVFILCIQCQQLNCSKLCVALVLKTKDRGQCSSPLLEFCAALLANLECESGAARKDATKEYTSGYL